MKKQLHNWRVLVELMEKQIWFYIDARNLFPKGAKIWVDAQKGLVNLEQNGKSYSGEGLPACLFVYTDVEKGERPDLDYIEEYAAEKFGLLATAS